MTRIAGDKDPITTALPKACVDERMAMDFLETLIWGYEPACPRCGDLDVYPMKERKTGERQANGRWRCRGCKQQYTVRTGTIMEDSRIPLKYWCFAFWRACSSKKGVSALQIKRETGLSYKSALFLMHRIRYAMSGGPDRPLRGTVEVDETYVGGKPRRHTRKQNRRPGENPNVQGRAPDFQDRKTPVVALVERGGPAKAISPGDEHVTGKNLKRIMRETVDPSATIMTDESGVYRGIGRHFEGGHYTVRHSIGEYVRGDVTTNTVEGFFSLLKRGVVGTFHHLSRKHLGRYVSEFEFRYNHRKVSDGVRTVAAIRAGMKKRLTYADHLASV